MTKPSGNPRGRPKGSKNKVKKTKDGTVKNPVGRPPGEAAVMKEYRDRMLNSPRSLKVLDSILKAAMDDEHKNQAAAWKIVVDRIMPVSSFDKLAGSEEGRNAIQINITGVPGVEVSAEAPLEGDFEPVESQ